MKFISDPKLKQRIEQLIDTNNLNVSLSDMFLSIINNPDIKDPSDLDELIDYWELDIDNSENNELIEKYIKGSIKLIKPEIYMSNSYYQAIKIKPINNSEYSLISDFYKPNEIFALDDIDVDDNYIEHTTLGYFPSKFPFIALNHRDITWMSITPNEIETMKSHIENASGNVVVFGLGLGYYPFMISAKQNVKSITIVEKDETIIKIFKEYLLPQFPNKNKIKIVQDDALNYHIPQSTNYVFIDLWHNAEDGIDLFVKFKSREKLSPSIKFSYWLENSFYAFLRRCFLTLLEEQFLRIPGLDYSHQETSFDKIVNALYSHTKNLTISSVEQLDKLLTNQELLKLIIG